MSKMLHSDADIPAFSHLSFSASRTLITPKYVVSCQSGGSCFSLSTQGPHCLQDVWFPAIWPVPPFSAHI